MIVGKYSEKFCLVPLWKIIWHWWVQFFDISSLNSLNLVLIGGEKLDGHPALGQGVLFLVTASNDL